MKHNPIPSRNKKTIIKMTVRLVIVLLDKSTPSINFSNIFLNFFMQISIGSFSFLNPVLLISKVG